MLSYLKTKQFLFLIIFIVLVVFLFSATSFADRREVAIVTTATDTAEWIYFSGPSHLATYIFITDICDKSIIELLKSPSEYAHLVYLSGLSTVADWIYLSDKSHVADWYYITDKESKAEITLCIPDEEMQTEKNIAIMLHLLKKGK